VINDRNNQAMTKGPRSAADGRSTAQLDPGRATRGRRPFASWVVPPWARSSLRRPGGRPIVVALGWLLLLAAAGSLVGTVAPPVAATVGSAGLTYNTDATATPAPGWLSAVVLLGSLLGFNLVYWSAAPRARVRQLGSMLALFGLELLGVIGCVVWVTGAEYPAGAVRRLSATDGDAAITLTLLFVVCISACGIMLWLTTNSTYEQQRDRYLYEGRATVATTKLGVRAHVWWVLGLLAVWALLFVPMIVSHSRTGDGSRALTPASTNLPWPTEYTYGDTLDEALSYYGVLFALAWSTSLSLLVEKVLYRGTWADRAEASRKSRRTGLASIHR
jgi:hypothetical protein